MVTIKSDQEPAVFDLQEESRNRIAEEMKKLVRGVQSIMDEVVFENSPVGDSESNGVIEGTMKQIQGQVRTLRLYFGGEFGRKFQSDDNIWPWPIEYAAVTFNRFKVGEKV